MKRKYSYIFFAILLIAILFNCKDDPTQPPTSEPFAVTISSDTTNVSGSSITKFVAVVSNNESSITEYKWSTDKGEFLSSITDSTVNWKAPSLSNSCEIMLRAIDGIDTVTATLTIEVDGFRAEIESSVQGSVASYTEITLKCNVFNSPSENLTYKWNSNKGFFLTDTTTSSVTWKAPGINTTCNIGVTVTDGVDTLMSNFNIDVDGFSVTVSPSTWSINGHGEKQLYAIVSNMPSSGLTYNWTSDKGDFLTSVTDSIVTWQAPNETTTCKIKVAVIDGIDTAFATASIGVTLVQRYELTFGLYDDFDGHGGEQIFDGSQLAVAGGLSTDLWRKDPRGSTSIVDLATINNDYISDGSNPSGNVVKMLSNFRGAMRLEIINPEDVNFVDYQSFSADLMISSESNSNDYSAGLDFHTSIPEQGGSSWYSGMGIKKDSAWGKTYIVINVKNKNTDYQTFEAISFVEEDVWFNLRMDLSKNNNSKLQIDFFVNDTLKYSEIPPDSEILLDPSRLAFGPKRSFETYQKNFNGNIIVFTDNIKAVYKNRVE